MTGLAEEMGKQFEEQQALIRDLVAALEPFAEEEKEPDDATYGKYRAACAALDRAKAAGYEP